MKTLQYKEHVQLHAYRSRGTAVRNSSDTNHSRDSLLVKEWTPPPLGNGMPESVK